MTTAPLTIDRFARGPDEPAWSLPERARGQCPLAFLALNAALCFVIYWGLTTRLNFDARQSWYPVFIHQAAAFLDRRLDVPLNPAVPGLSGSDLSFYNGRYYPYWPPLPSLLSVPLVALFGPAASDKLPAAALAALNVFLLGLVLNLAARRARLDLSPPTIVLLQLFYAFGSEPFSCVLSSGAMNQALILHETCLLASLAFLFADPSRPRNILCAGLLWCACILTRTHALLLAPLYALIVWRAHTATSAAPVTTSHAERSEASLIAPYVQHADNRPIAIIPHSAFRIPHFLAIPHFRSLALCGALGLALMLLWNDLRFDSPFSSGVEHQLYGAASAATVLHEAPHGLLSPHYIPRNLWAQLFRPMFTLRASFPFLAPDGLGHGILLTTPLWWLLLLRWRAVRRNTLARDCLLGAACVWLLLLCWYSTGGTQFGMRFLMDLLPLLLIPLAVAIGPRPSRGVLVLCALSIVLRLGGTFLYMLDGIGGRMPPLAA